MRARKELCFRCAGCVCVCPFGASELADETLVIDEKKCTNCGICAAACPVRALER